MQAKTTVKMPVQWDVVVVAVVQVGQKWVRVVRMWVKTWARRLVEQAWDLVWAEEPLGRAREQLVKEWVEEILILAEFWRPLVGR
jgi:hypothetical protein